ncbi:hypothetical protein D3C86_2159800 [compost metagenome]
MLCHQFGDPIDEHAQLDADMPVRRKRHVNRNRLETPCLERGHQLALRHMGRGHVIRQPQHAQAD